MFEEVLRMPRNQVELLELQMEEAYWPLRRRLEGLSDEELWWEPVPGAWTLRRQPDGRLMEDYEDRDPVPAPFTTLAWRLFHVASCKVMYHEWAFGPAQLTWLTIDRPETVGPMVEMLERGHELLVRDLEDISDDDGLEKPVKTNWGEEWPAWRIFWTMIQHDAHHGGEIGCVRDLYFHRV
jgi:DinB superfamily